LAKQYLCNKYKKITLKKDTQSILDKILKTLLPTLFKLEKGKGKRENFHSNLRGSLIESNSNNTFRPLGYFDP
jgi:hypothetical protein